MTHELQQASRCLHLTKRYLEEVVYDGISPEQAKDITALVLSIGDQLKALQQEVSEHLDALEIYADEEVMEELRKFLKDKNKMGEI